MYWHAVGPHRISPPVRNRQTDFRQDSTVCTACAKHLFKTEAITCSGKCKGEFHVDCSRRYLWMCNECQKENTVTKNDIALLTSASVDTKGNFTAKLKEFRVEMEAVMQSHFAIVKEQLKEVKSSVDELRSSMALVEGKLLVPQTNPGQIDISGVQDTLNKASRFIITEMCRTLDRLVEQKKPLLLESAKIPSKMFSKELGVKVEDSGENCNRQLQEMNFQRKSTLEQPGTRLQQLAAQYRIAESKC